MFSKKSKKYQIEESNSELLFIFNGLILAEAFEWAYFICLIWQDIQLFYEKVICGLESRMHGNILPDTLNRLHAGTIQLSKWADKQWWYFKLPYFIQNIKNSIFIIMNKFCILALHIYRSFGCSKN